MSYSAQAKSLGISSRRVSAIAHGDERLPTAIYEKTRTLHRTSISQALQREGFSGTFRKSHERATYQQLTKISSDLNSVVNKTYESWNRSYISYKRDPADWKRRNGWAHFKGKHDKRAKWHTPKELSKAQIRKNITKGASRVEELEKAENDQGEFVSPPIDEDVEKE